MTVSKLTVMHNRQMQTMNMRKHYIEHFVMIKMLIMQEINAAAKLYYIPFISLSIDLIQMGVQNKKMIGLADAFWSSVNPKRTKKKIRSLSYHKQVL
jgi:hypothetical protein